MSSDYYPCWSWLLPITDENVEALGITVESLCEQYGEFIGNEELTEWRSMSAKEIIKEIAHDPGIDDDEKTIKTVIPGTNLPFELTVGIPSYDGGGGDFETDKPHFMFQREELFTEYKTAYGQLLSDRNLFPEEKHWVVYG